MSISAIFGSRIAVMPSSSATSSFGAGNGATKAAPRIRFGENGGGLVIECSSRPQKKGTKHHIKTRPRKTQLWDIKRKPTVYAPLPPLPSEWTLLSSSSTTDVVDAVVTTPPPTPSSQPPPPISD